METENSLTAARGKGGLEGNGGRKGKGVVKEHVGMTHADMDNGVGTCLLYTSPSPRDLH